MKKHILFFFTNEQCVYVWINECSLYVEWNFFSARNETCRICFIKSNKPRTTTERSLIWRNRQILKAIFLNEKALMARVMMILLLKSYGKRWRLAQMMLWPPPKRDRNVGGSDLNGKTNIPGWDATSSMDPKKCFAHTARSREGRMDSPKDQQTWECHLLLSTVGAFMFIHVSEERKFLHYLSIFWSYARESIDGTYFIWNSLFFNKKYY